MTTTSQNQKKFQQLLRELFQFDCADLDFGIYRIMNHKREVIEKFISEDLEKAVSEELDQGVLHDQELALSELKDTTQLIRETLGNKALDAAGNLNETYHDIPIGQKYLKLQRRTRGARSRATLERDIFNHLFAFFSRYYQEGDFISKRRYSRQQRYAIPYNGEEVYLHWANADQYYIKTAEHFHDYSYRAHGAAIHFKLQAADVEHNNVKGDKRFFLPCISDISVDANEKQLIIPFEYRPLDEQEQEHYGAADRQETIISECVREMTSRPGLPNEIHLALTAERRRNAENEPVTYLEHHLRQYTRRNTSDFFIHKNLKVFLSRELEFYIKSEVLNLDDLELAGEGFAEGWFQVIRVIRTIGERIIDFLEQIEGFQKLLWEKRKFITETQYCITLTHIHERFYPAIASCEPQWMEWNELFHVDENETDLFNSSGNVQERRAIFMRDHPTLVLDTRHFSEKFKDELLASLENIDELCDGLLVHSENFQALSFLNQRYQQQIKCIHIDPPYNTDTSGFLYKNDYRHSSWMAFMESRILASTNMLADDGAYLCHIDEHEYERLKLLFEKTDLSEGGTVIWDKKNPMLGRKGIATQHEYILWKTNNGAPVYLSPTNVLMMMDKVKSLISEHGEVNDKVRQAYSNWVNKHNELTGGERAYRFINDDGRIFQSVGMGAPEPRTDPKFHQPLVHPLTKKECPVPSSGWSRAPETLLELAERNEIIFGKDESVQPRRKIFLKADNGRQLPSVLSSSARGKNDLDKLGFEFPYCHPVSLYADLLGAATEENADIALDYFAGSGTTGHAVINLNREDDGNRKFILVEMGQYFDTVLLPRLKKVTFTPEWKDGKPKRMATQEEAARAPRIIKYLRLESYEDALNNINVDDSASQQAMKFDDYLISYMLRVETRHSATLLNVEQLARPFDYKLFIRNNGATREQRIDIPETFNYLLGLQVQTRRTCHDEGRRYLVVRGLLEGRQTTVIWRETEGWQKPELERDLQFVTEQKLTEEADEIYANGDSFIPGAKSLDPVFKARMFALIPE
ncbi:MAG: DNA methyltransferase [Gammaproteobacteria bacterium]|nr:DNA methyltransferase [Gammaproteobacteria bacterium]